MGGRDVSILRKIQSLPIPFVMGQSSVEINDERVSETE